MLRCVRERSRPSSPSVGRSLVDFAAMAVRQEPCIGLLDRCLLIM
jgi:hypothetical protein